MHVYLQCLHKALLILPKRKSKHDLQFYVRHLQSFVLIYTLLDILVYLHWIYKSIDSECSVHLLKWDSSEHRQTFTLHQVKARTHSSFTSACTLYHANELTVSKTHFWGERDFYIEPLSIGFVNHCLYVFDHSVNSWWIWNVKFAEFARM